MKAEMCHTGTDKLKWKFEEQNNEKKEEINTRHQQLFVFNIFNKRMSKV